MRVIIEPRLLSDRSQVFDVALIMDGTRITIPACSEEDARLLAYRLIEALREHSTLVVWEW
jgi:hypothetical protein